MALSFYTVGDKAASPAIRHQVSHGRPWFPSLSPPACCTALLRVGVHTCSLSFLPPLWSLPPSPPYSVLSPPSPLLSFSPRYCDQEKFAEPHAGWISATVCLILCSFMDCNPPGFCPWDSPGKNTGMGCHALLQGIFPSRGSNLHLLCLGFLPLAPQGKPFSNRHPPNFKGKKKAPWPKEFILSPLLCHFEYI